MSVKATEPNPDQQAFWQLVLETYQASGLSVRQFCKQEGLSQPSFYAWRKRLRPTGAPEAVPSSAARSSEFIEVTMPSDVPCALELALSSGHVLRIHRGADSQTLTYVLSALRETHLC